MRVCKKYWPFPVVAMMLALGQSSAVTPMVYAIF